MKPSLQPGLAGSFRYTVPENKTVPHIYPEAVDFQSMPRVFATGYLVALCEWACIEMIKPHLDANEQSVGTHVNLSHSAATPPGLTVTVSTRLDSVDGRKLIFSVVAHDGVDPVSEGTHERVIIDPEKFAARVQAKAAR